MRSLISGLWVWFCMNAALGSTPLMPSLRSALRCRLILLIVPLVGTYATSIASAWIFLP